MLFCFCFSSVTLLKIHLMANFNICQWCAQSWYRNVLPLSIPPATTPPHPTPPLTPSCVEPRENLGEVSGQCTPCKQKPPCPPQTQMFFIDPLTPPQCIGHFKISLSLYYANTAQTVLHRKTGSHPPPQKKKCTATVNSLGQANR